MLAEKEALPLQDLELRIFFDAVGQRDGAAAPRRADAAGFDPDIVLERWVTTTCSPPELGHDSLSLMSLRDVLNAALALPPLEQKALRLALEPPETWALDELEPALQHELIEALAEAQEGRGDWTRADDVLARLDRLTAKSLV